MRLAQAKEHWLADTRVVPASALVVHAGVPEGRAIALRLALAGARVSEAPPHLVGPAVRRLRHQPPPRALVLVARRGARRWAAWREANIASPLRGMADAEFALRRAGACSLLLLAEALPGGAREARQAEDALRGLLAMVADSLGPLARVNALVRNPGDDALRVAAVAEAMLGARLMRRELVWHGRR